MSNGKGCVNRHNSSVFFLNVGGMCCLCEDVGQNGIYIHPGLPTTSMSSKHRIEKDIGLFSCIFCFWFF